MARIADLKIWVRLTAAIWLMLVVFWTGLIFWESSVNRHTAIQQAKEFSQSMHETTMAGLTGMMITGTVGQRMLFTLRNVIFNKLQEREGLSGADVLAGVGGRPSGEIGEPESDLWALVLEASRLDDVVDQVVRTLEFSVLAKYAFGLAQLFNGFYHKYPILNEEDADRKYWRAAGVAYFRVQLTRALALMGIDVPARM